MQQEEKNKSTKKKLSGIVVSDKMNKTVVVAVTSVKEHPKYKKRYKRVKKYKARDEENRFHIGDTVVIEESRPFSKETHWIVLDKK